MKINFNSVDLRLSGGNRFLFELSNGLVERGHHVTFTHVGRPYFKNWFAPIKADVKECGLGMFSIALSKLGLKRIDELEEQQRLLITNCPECDVNVASFWATAKPTFESRKGKPFYIIQHYAPYVYPENRLEYLQSFEYPMTKLCVSDWVAKKIGGYNIGNGINLKRFRRNQKIDKIPKSIMYSARSQSWKNREIGFSVLSALEHNGYKILLTQERSSDYELIRMYNQAEIYLNFSDKEGFGYGPIEAMACGCAVVSTPCSEYLRDEVNCMIVSSNSRVKDIVTKISDLYLDQVKFSILKANGYITAEEHDIKCVVDRFAEIIQTKEKD